MRKIILASFVLFYFAAPAKGQDAVHDYLELTEWGGYVVIVSTDSVRRVERTTVEEGSEGQQVRNIISANMHMIRLIQDYELKGWEFLTIHDGSSGPTWVMRKPKQ